MNRILLALLLITATALTRIGIAVPDDLHRHQRHAHGVHHVPH